MTDKNTTSPSVIKGRLNSWQYIAQAIKDGLEGKTFVWTAGELEAYRPKAKTMGATLVTKSQIARMGYRIKRGAKPVGNGYFRSPISKSANLYVLECQAVPETHADDQ